MAEIAEVLRCFGGCTCGLLIIMIMMALVWYSLKSYLSKQRQLRRWKKLLSEQNSYQAAYQTGGVELLVELVFCDLFMAHCIEIREQADKGKPRYLYKIRNEIDISLLNEFEQVIARNLMDFCDFQSLLEQASSQLNLMRDVVIQTQTTLLFANIRQGKDIHGLANQYRQIITEAIKVNPISSSGCN